MSLVDGKVFVDAPNGARAFVNELARVAVACGRDGTQLLLRQCAALAECPLEDWLFVLRWLESYGLIEMNDCFTPALYTLGPTTLGLLFASGDAEAARFAELEVARRLRDEGIAVSS